jgi:hypothetical protein
MTSDKDFNQLTHKQAVDRVLTDPTVAAQVMSIPSIAAAMRRYSEEIPPGLLAELADLGFHVHRVGELKQLEDYRAAVPVLVKWLPQVSYLAVANDIAGTLSVPWAARQACPVFLELYRRPPRFLDPEDPPPVKPVVERFRQILGSGLRFFVCPEFADELIEFATDQSLPNRGFVVSALPKTKDSRVPQVLMSLLDDPAVCAYAIDPLGKMRYEPAREKITALLNDPDKSDLLQRPGVQVQAKKALKRLDAARQKLPT